jgi:hypothetical protein
MRTKAKFGVQIARPLTYTEQQKNYVIIIFIMILEKVI